MTNAPSVSHVMTSSSSPQLFGFGELRVESKIEGGGRKLSSESRSNQAQYPEIELHMHASHTSSIVADLSSRSEDGAPVMAVPR